MGTEYFPIFCVLFFNNILSFLVLFLVFKFIPGIFLFLESVNEIFFSCFIEI